MSSLVFMDNNDMYLQIIDVSRKYAFKYFSSYINV